MVYTDVNMMKLKPNKTICVQDPAAALNALAEAIQRLQAAVDFNRGDTAPLNALGDVLCAACDLHLQQHGSQEAVAASTVTTAALHLR